MLMKYPNATVGSREIFVGEILLMIFSIFSSIGMMFVYFAQNNIQEIATSMQGTTSFAAWFASISDAAKVGLGAIIAVIGAGAIILVGAICFGIVGFVIAVTGVINAKRDESSFRLAIIALILSITLPIAGMFLDDPFSGILSGLGTLAELAVTCYIVTGFRKLARALGNEEVDAKGLRVIKYTVVLCIFSAVISLIAEFISGPTGGTLTAISVPFTAVWYYLFLGFIRRSKKMLNKQEPDKKESNKKESNKEELNSEKGGVEENE